MEEKQEPGLNGRAFFFAVSSALARCCAMKTPRFVALWGGEDGLGLARDSHWSLASSLVVPCPTTIISNLNPHSFRCSTNHLTIARRSSSVRARRSPLIGVRGRAKPMPNSRCPSTFQPATRPCAGSLVPPTLDLFSVCSYLALPTTVKLATASPLPIF